MGNFSWIKADNLTKTANICFDQSYKLLIPEEFGGGYIKDKYRGYGIIYFKQSDKFYDIYELLAFWNKNVIYDDKSLVIEHLGWKVSEYGFHFPDLKSKDDYTDHNRHIGIKISFNDSSMLKYPLKLVSPSFKGSYKDCKGISFPDPFQGYGNLSREKFLRDHEELYKKWHKYYEYEEE